MPTTPRTTATDSLTFLDIYRADHDQLEQRLAQLRLVREIRAERELLGRERPDTARSTSSLGRWLRTVGAHIAHPISSHHAAPAA
jgi:hypothetical protein